MKNILMIEKSGNPIIIREVSIIDIKEIEQYLIEVKEAVSNNRYRLDRNPKRQDNIDLFLEYVIDEARVKEILLSLKAEDFSEVLQNRHRGFEHEQKYPLTYRFKMLEDK